MPSLDRRNFLFATAIVTPLVLTGCGGEAGSSGGTPTLTYMTGPEPAGLDPVNLSITAGSGQAGPGYAVYDMLMKENPSTGKVDAGTAESLTSEDFQTWTLRLRKGVRFSDGSAYDAAAVKFNWTRHADPALKSPAASVVAQIKSMKVVDPATLGITLVAVNAQWPHFVANALPFIGSPKAIKAKGKDFASSPVGAGPFLFESWRRGDQMVMKKNPKYFAGVPAVDTLVIRTIPDEQQRADTVAATSGAMARMADPTAVASAKSAGAIGHVTPLSGGATLVMNLRRAPFDDPRIREAMWLAFDAADYNDVVLRGAGQVPTSFFAEQSVFYSPEVSFPKPDLARAQSLVDEYRADKGAVTVSIQTQQPAVAEYLQQTFAKLNGLTVKVQQLAGPEQVANAFSGDFDLTTLAMHLVYPAPMMHEEFRTAGTRNFSGYSNKEADRIIAEIEQTEDPETQRDLYADLQRVLIDDHVELITSRTGGLDILGAGVQVPAWYGDGIPALEKASVKG